MRLLLAFFVVATLAVAVHAEDLEIARAQSIKSGKPLMIVFR